MNFNWLKKASDWLRFFPLSYLQSSLPTSYIFHGKIDKEKSWKFSETQLHVFVPDENKIAESMDKFFTMFNSRSRANREFWLLDVSSLMLKFNDVFGGELMKNLKVDLDDDFYTFSSSSDNDQIIQINEVYKIRQNFEFIILPYGIFTIQRGLELSTTEKWTRRKDLRVSTSRVKKLIFLKKSFKLWIWFFVLKIN